MSLVERAQPVRLDRDGGVGAMVMSVDGDGPGAKVGVHQGDVLQACDGQPIDVVVKRARSFSRSAKGLETLSATFTF